MYNTVFWYRYYGVRVLLTQVEGSGRLALVSRPSLVFHFVGPATEGTPSTTLQATVAVGDRRAERSPRVAAHAVHFSIFVCVCLLHILVVVCPEVPEVPGVPASRVFLHGACGATRPGTQDLYEAERGNRSTNTLVYRV